MRCSLSRTPRAPVISKPARRRAFLSSSTTGYESSSPSAMTSLSPLPTVGGSTLTLRTLSVPEARCSIQPSGAPPHTYRQWNLAATTDELERAGFEVLDGREELHPGMFYDIGAVVLYLRIIPWQIPGFDLAGYDQILRSLHAMMESGTPLKVNGHRFLVIARST
jgi:hypothetical protein